MGAKKLRAQMVARKRVQGIEGETERGSKMIYKRGKIYWYKFMWNGELIRESTRQGNDKKARNIESAHRTSLANGLVGIREKKVTPTLGTFCKDRVEPWAKSSFEITTPNTWFWFRTNIKVICEDRQLSSLRLNEVNNETLSQFEARRLELGKKISYVNSTLRVVRRALRLAVEWDVIDSARQIKLLAGENRRDHVVTPEEERQFLATAEKHDSEIGHVVICLVDTGLRPEEFYSLRWEHINWKNGQSGTIFIPSGKTAAARRIVFQSARVRFVLEHRWEVAGSPCEGWVWPSCTKSGHFEQSTIKKRLEKNLQRCDESEKEAKQATNKSGQKAIHVRRFIPYNLRHTFLTRLGESGCDAWTLAKIAGHSNIAIGSRYVHPSEAAMEKAVSQMGGYRIGHSEEICEKSGAEREPVTKAEKDVKWCARRDSNSRPNAPEAFALSS
jgi:integrase